MEIKKTTNISSERLNKVEARIYFKSVLLIKNGEEIKRPRRALQ